MEKFKVNTIWSGVMTSLVPEFICYLWVTPCINWNIIGKPTKSFDVSNFCCVVKGGHQHLRLGYDSHRSKNIWAARLFFCQNDILFRESFWQKEKLVALIIFEIYLLWLPSRKFWRPVFIYCSLWKRICNIMSEYNISQTLWINSILSLLINVTYA